MTTVPTNLFINNTAVTSLENVFEACTSLESVPESLFESMVNVSDMDYAFNGCTKLSGRIKITSPNVRYATDFCKNTGPITVVVPAGSRTETTFKSLASSLSNLTVETY